MTHIRVLSRLSRVLGPMVGLLAMAGSAASWTSGGVPVGAADSLQLTPIIARDAGGGAFVAWEDRRSGNGAYTFLQHLTSEGVPAPGWLSGGQRLDSPGYRDHPVIISDGRGGVYVADDGTVVHGLGRDLIAHIQGDGLVLFNGTLTGDPYGIDGGVHADYLPCLAPDDSGGVYVSWTFRDRFREIAKLTRLRPDAIPALRWSGNGNEPSPGYVPQEGTVVCPDGAGGAFVAWQETSYLPIDHFDQRGAVTIGWPVRATSSLAGAIGVVPDKAGGAFVAWQDNRNGAYEQTLAQHLVADGTPALGWPSGGVVLSAFPTDAGIHRAPFDFFVFQSVRYSSVISDEVGGAFIVWTDYRDSAGTGQGDIYAQHIRRDGAIVWPANGLAICKQPGDQRFPTVSTDGSGGLLVTWQDARNGQYDIYVQHVAASGAIMSGWPENGAAVCTVSGDQVKPVIVSDGAGAIVAWEDHRGAVPQIYSAKLSPDGVVPVLLNLESAEATPDHVRLVWYVGPRAAGAVGIERRREDSDWETMARVSPDAANHVAFEDRDIVPGGRYGYRLALGSVDGSQHAGETWLSVPRLPEFALESPQPNPTASGFEVVFSLPDAEPARLEMLDVAGRRVLGQEVGLLGAGRHLLKLGSENRLQTGFYILRLVRPDRQASRRLLVTH